MRHGKPLALDVALGLAAVEFGPGAGHAFARALRTAHRQGRLSPELAALAGVETGAYPCPLCGTGHWLEVEAIRCCTPQGW